MPAGNGVHSHSRGRQSFVIVFDFDDTVMNCNTDSVIPDALGRKELLESLLASNMQFTTACDTIIAPFTAAQLREAAEKSVVVDPQMPAVFEFLRSLREKHETLLEVNIASDSNMLYIESSLDARLPGVREFISQIHTNAYEEVIPGETVEPWDKSQGLMRKSEEERDATYNAGQTRHSRLFWYEAHHCQCCLDGGKPNMCKSRIIHRILQTTTCLDPTVIFIGDGRNDYCPVQHVLRPRDYVFARRGYPLHRELANPEKGFGSCHVRLWSDAAELLAQFTQVILHTPRLPTIVRFRDVSEAEFRTVSITQRVPNIFTRLLEAQERGEGGETRREIIPMTAASIQGVKAFIASLRENLSVPLLPGERCVPQWLHNMSTLAEYDTPAGVSLPLSSTSSTGLDKEAKGQEKEKTGVLYPSRSALCAPRWGQVPWLHGEIYMYHLLWQWMLLNVEDDRTPDAKSIQEEEGEESHEVVVNHITPYTIDNPLYSMQSSGKHGTFHAKNIALPSAVPPYPMLDKLKTSFLAYTPSSVLKGIRWQGEEGRRTKERAPATLIPRQTFSAYRDIFIADKKEVTLLFLKSRIVPMVACQPWRRPQGGASHGKDPDKVKKDTEKEEGSSLLKNTDTFALLPTILRWMLWGNGVDLSMFTMKELTAGGNGKESTDEEITKKGNTATSTRDATSSASSSASPSSTINHVQKGKTDDKKEEEKSKVNKHLEERRHREKTLMESMEQFLVGNEAAALQAYIEHVVLAESKTGGVQEGGSSSPSTCHKRDSPHSSTNSRKAALETNHVDIVCDNVGVELVADLLFALWFITHSSASRPSPVTIPTVTFHVKPMPYYISDVTTRDIALQLEWIEEGMGFLEGEKNAGEENALHSETDASSSSLYTEEEKKYVKEFISLIREAFSSGQFLLDSDLVWTQPSEYRELSPEVFNKQFYTQFVTLGSSSYSTVHPKEERHEKQGSGNEEVVVNDATQQYRENKSCVTPKTALVIFKGDLNYRRVVGDRHWCSTDFTTSLLEKSKVKTTTTTAPSHRSDDPSSDLYTTLHWNVEVQHRVGALLADTPAEHILDAPTFAEVVGAYWPTQCIPVCSIRTIKSECCVGVPGALKKELDKSEGFGWRVSGKYGEILLAS